MDAPPLTHMYAPPPALQKEMDAYCHLVTAGSYCIVEDTKMSRWSSDGPLTAVKTYMQVLGGGGRGCMHACSK